MARCLQAGSEHGQLCTGSRAPKLAAHVAVGKLLFIECKPLRQAHRLMCGGRDSLASGPHMLPARADSRLRLPRTNE